jgi:hypothetical protein
MGFARRMNERHAACGGNGLSIKGGIVREETIRRSNDGEIFTHPTSKAAEEERDDEMLLFFRNQGREQEPLTKREREQRWPIG